MNIQYLLIVLAGAVAGLQQKRMADYFNASGPEVLREVTSTQGRWQTMTAAYKVIKDYENKANGSTGGEGGCWIRKTKAALNRRIKYCYCYSHGLISR